MKTLLELQELDLQIEACKLRELEIPKQKNKFDIQRKRLASELEEREKGYRDLTLAQRAAEGEIEKHKGQVAKYEQQLLGVKKNEEYQALLHEMDLIKKQISIQEERVISIMVELDDGKVSLAENRKRIESDMKSIAAQCAAIDEELAEAVRQRGALETRRVPLAAQVEPALMHRYKRIRASKKTGPAAVPLRGDHCSGCNMAVPAQIVNEVLGGRVHGCNFCGRLLYCPEFHGTGAVNAPIA